MPKPTRNWVLFTLFLYLVIFMLIPPRRGPRLSPFGFWLGFVQAVVLNAVCVGKLKLWKLPGDLFLAGIPLFTALAWIPPAILFANFFPAAKSRLLKSAYILLFAAAATFTQKRLRLMGMWENIRWKDFYTFPLAILTHTLMAILLPLFKAYPRA